MRLLIDIGNTRAKYVLVDDKQLEKDLFSSVKYLDFGQLTVGYFEQVFSFVDEIVVASVQINEQLATIEHWTKQKNIRFYQVQSSKQALGVTSSYDKSSTLGVDRWLAMIGASKLFPNENILIIDAGTAITVDLLSATGQHLGGWIMPGISTMYSGLINNTDKVSAELQPVAAMCFGDSTEKCVNNGIWALAVGVIEQAIKRAKEQVPVDKVLILGGDGEQISKLLNENITLQPNLIFHGLHAFKAL